MLRNLPAQGSIQRSRSFPLRPTTLAPALMRRSYRRGFKPTPSNVLLHLTQSQAAAHLNLSPRTLEKYRRIEPWPLASFPAAWPPPKYARDGLASGARRPQAAPPSAGGLEGLHGQSQSECRQNRTERLQPQASFLGQRAIQGFPAEAGLVRQRGHATQGVGDVRSAMRTARGSPSSNIASM